ncbi:uncharacterized protein N7515_009413 [Penicillium bovifimosum]|uniref:Uncharacterized protein n=1 Tax=Penicillium bovifimosum TaxID=126998 RepID=A0A9W9GKJ3_9EURO|nr:uncharacterized protein N7515_009413 [Penicillium bovifimosum]KAJ5121452.1 hypothetical protein N7515_009413 [Penicillium bovifimosum]
MDNGEGPTLPEAPRRRMGVIPFHGAVPRTGSPSCQHTDGARQSHDQIAESGQTQNGSHSGEDLAPHEGCMAWLETKQYFNNTQEKLAVLKSPGQSTLIRGHGDKAPECLV